MQECLEQLQMFHEKTISQTKTYMEAFQVSKIQEQRMRLTGHCVRHNADCVIHTMLLMVSEPYFGCSNKGSPKVSYTEQQIKDVNVRS